VLIQGNLDTSVLKGFLALGYLDTNVLKGVNISTLRHQCIEKC